MKTNKQRIQRITGIGLFSAAVVVLQFVSMSLRFTTFSITLTLIPIVVGAAIYGIGAGAWLGLVFGLAVLLTGDAASFLAISFPGTIITVLLKGAGCGFIAGLAFKIFAPKLKFFAAILSSLLCPIVNTGIFLLGSAVFFMPHAQAIGDMVGVDGAGFGVFIALAFGNFIIEVLMCGLLSPVFVRIIKIVKLGKK